MRPPQVVSRQGQSRRVFLHPGHRQKPRLPGKGLPALYNKTLPGAFRQRITKIMEVLKMNIITRIFRVKSKATVYFGKNGEVIEITGNIGKTRMNRAASAFHFDEVKPTFGMKIRAALHNCFCFFREAAKKRRRNRRRHYCQRDCRQSGSRHDVVYRIGERCGI